MISCSFRSEIASGSPRLSAARAAVQKSAAPAGAERRDGFFVLTVRLAVFVARIAGFQAVTGTRPAGAFLALIILCLGTSRLNSRAALKPRMLRLARSSRNGSVVIELGRSKSQCGQSEANKSCVSAL